MDAGSVVKWWGESMSDAMPAPRPCPKCSGVLEPVPMWTVTPEAATYVAVMGCAKCGHSEPLEEGA